VDKQLVLYNETSQSLSARKIDIGDKIDTGEHSEQSGSGSICPTCLRRLDKDGRQVTVFTLPKTVYLFAPLYPVHE
jgi:hypothetical protein